MKWSTTTPGHVTWNEEVLLQGLERYKWPQKRNMSSTNWNDNMNRQTKRVSGHQENTPLKNVNTAPGHQKKTRVKNHKKVCDKLTQIV